MLPNIQLIFTCAKMLYLGFCLVHKTFLQRYRIKKSNPELKPLWE